VRKIDWKIMAMAAIAFSALNLDRSNINQANSSTILPDLGLTTDGDCCVTEGPLNADPLRHQTSTSETPFSVFRSFAPSCHPSLSPSGCVSLPGLNTFDSHQQVGPDRWIPVQICLWSKSIVHFYTVSAHEIILGIVTLCQFWLTGRSSFLGCRALLGCEAFFLTCL
jgi:hypothetical protein